VWPKHAAFFAASSQPTKGPVVTAFRAGLSGQPTSQAVCTAQWPTEYALRISLVRDHLRSHGSANESAVCVAKHEALRSHRVNLRRVRRHSLPRSLAVNRRHSRLHSPVAKPIRGLRISLVADHLRSHGVPTSQPSVWPSTQPSSQPSSQTTKGPSSQPSRSLAVNRRHSVCTAQWQRVRGLRIQPSAGPSSQPTECHESGLLCGQHAASSQPSSQPTKVRRHSLPRS